MKSLFDTSAYEEIKNRFNALTEESTPSWGKMNVGQMTTHCQFPKVWRKSLPTAKQAKITDKRELNTEREKLLSMIDAFYNKREQTEWLPHPYFGHFTPEQWGQLEYKHLDYHLTQFGV